MKTITALASLLSLVAFGAEAQLESLRPEVSYSGWRVITNGDSLLMEGPYHYADGKHRSEISAGGQNFIAIVREDRELLWTLMSAQSMYMEVSLDDRELGNGTAFEGAEIVESRRIGAEVVNDQSTTKYDVTLRDADGQTLTGSLWATDQMIPVKMDMVAGGNRFVVEVRDIEVGPQPEELFEVPAGYAKFSMGSLGNLGNVFRGAAGNSPTQSPAENQSSDDREPGFVEGLATEAVEGAQEATEQGVRQGVRENVGRRIRGIFNRD